MTNQKRMPIKSIFRVSVFTLLFSVMCVTSTVNAQEMLSLENAIALAMQYNYGILLSRQDSASAALDYEYRNMVFLPRINANAAVLWTENAQRQKFTDANNNKKGRVSTANLTASVNLNWTLFDGLKMFTTRKIAAENINLGTLEVRKQVVNTIADVITTYYDIVRQKQQLVTIEDQMEISQERVNLAQRKLDIGLGTKPEVLQGKVDLNAQKAAHLDQEKKIRQLKELLGQIIRPASEDIPGGFMTEFEVTDSIPVSAIKTLEEEQQMAYASNPDLLLTRKAIDITALSVKNIRGDLWPTIQFNSALNYIKTTNDIALNPFLPLSNRTAGFNYGFTATIPILNYRNTHRLIEQEELNLGFQRLYLSNQQSLLQIAIRNAHENYDFQLEALALEESNIGLAQENMDIIRETYKLGQATYLELREAQKSLADAQTRLINARYGAKVAETELMRLKGELVR